MSFIYFIHVMCWNIPEIYLISFIHVIHATGRKINAELHAEKLTTS